MKMSAFIILILASLALVLLFIRRDCPRITAGPASAVRRKARVRRFVARPGKVRPAPPPAYAAGNARRLLLEILRREEAKQRPQEGRN